MGWVVPNGQNLGVEGPSFNLELQVDNLGFMICIPVYYSVRCVVGGKLRGLAQKKCGL